MRVARSRVLVAEGYALATVARVMQVSRQALYRVTHPRRAPARRRPADGSVEAAIVEVPKANPTDGYRLVTAWVARKLGVAVNRKRVLRVMREQKLIQRRHHEPKRRRPGFFKVEHPGQLWHLDMTSVWVAEHGWVYLNAIIDCCTREIVGWQLSLRCRAAEAITVIEHAVLEQGIAPGTLTLGTDNGSAFTARATRLVISGLGVTHRRGGYRDPESQAFIESWFSLPEGALRLAQRARDTRPGPGGDRRLHRPLPRPAPQPTRLQTTARGPRDIGRCTASTTKRRGLTCQHRRGALHSRHFGRTLVGCSTATRSQALPGCIPGFDRR